LIVNVTCSVDDGRISVSTLDELDAVLASVGLRREVRSPIVSGKSYSSSYEGADVDQATVEAKISEVASKHGFKATVEVEESVKFP
jgi:uncharacterized protein YidB (DUF937 family)